MTILRAVNAFLLLSVFPGDALKADQSTSPPLQSEIVSLFEVRTIHFSSGKYKKEELPYRLYSPPTIQEEYDQKYPLVVWLHGHGDAGEENRGQLLHMEWFFGNQQEAGGLPCFVLAYQCSSKRPLWTDGPIEEQAITICKAIIDDLVATQPIDIDRIVLVGISTGGTGCWEAITRYPDTFAAAAPLSPGGYQGNLQELARATKNTPIWAFHAKRDPLVPYELVRSVVKEIVELGGNAFLTETPGETHFSWLVAFPDFDLFQWLMEQNRSKQSPKPNYWSLTNWWHLELQEKNFIGPLAVPVAFLFLFVVWRRAARKRHVCKKGQSTS